jgi:hypothetical protein
LIFLLHSSFVVNAFNLRVTDSLAPRMAGFYLELLIIKIMRILRRFSCVRHPNGVLNLVSNHASCVGGSIWVRMLVIADKRAVLLLGYCQAKNGRWLDLICKLLRRKLLKLSLRLGKVFFESLKERVLQLTWEIFLFPLNRVLLINNVYDSLTSYRVVYASILTFTSFGLFHRYKRSSLVCTGRRYNLRVDAFMLWLVLRPSKLLV